MRLGRDRHGSRVFHAQWNRVGESVINCQMELTKEYHHGVPRVPSSSLSTPTCAILFFLYGKKGSTDSSHRQPWDGARHDHSFHHKKYHIELFPQAVESIFIQGASLKHF